MFFKIYFGEKPLFLCDEFTTEIQGYMHHDDAVMIDEFSVPALNSMIHEMKQQSVHAGIFYFPDLERLKKAFWKKFTIVPAAGGLVKNERGEGLFIYRKGKWDLPKGKLDPGESIEDCAVREVREETGLRHINIAEHLLNTYHTYSEGGKFLLKETQWFRMHASGQQSLTPQVEEQIADIRWIAANELDPVLENTYPSIKDVLERAGYLSK